MSEKIVKIYVAGHCGPCQEVKDFLGKGQFSVNGEEAKVDLVDIETEEGFLEVAEKGLEGVPAAYREGQKCIIRIDDENQMLILECP